MTFGRLPGSADSAPSAEAVDCPREITSEILLIMAERQSEARPPRTIVVTTLQVRAWLAYAGLVALGLLCMWLSLWDGRHLLSSFGHALVIAGALALTVEGFARRHVLEEISKDIYQFLMGHGLPAALQDKIRNVMTISLVRHEVFIRYRLERVENRWRLHVQEEWQIRNHSGSPKPYQTYMGAEEYENLRIVNLECQGGDNSYSLDAAEMPLVSVPEKDGVVRAYGRRITVPPGGEPIRITWRFSVDPPERSNLHAWGLPTVNVRFEIDPCPGFEFLVRDADERVGQTWTLRKAFMPGETIRVVWFPEGTLRQSGKHSQPASTHDPRLRPRSPE